MVVRAGSRRRLGTSDSGLVEELLSPDLGGSFEMVRSIFAPRAELTIEARRPTEEAGYVVSGIFDIEISGVWHRLGEGDSFRFDGKPYRWRNPGAEPAVVIWVVSPPVESQLMSRKKRRGFAMTTCIKQELKAHRMFKRDAL